jgi:asparagine synthase (glutamine-hydrolysing)
MCNEDGTIWIVFNGEIYNFLELRPDLERKGHQFQSNTDTEVILHLYEEYGPACVQQLRGMFAFALWDSLKGQLLLVRDRLGVKPLHYAITAEGLLFGSEIKAIMASGEADLAMDEEAIHQYMLWQCIPSPRTAFRGIRKLPPASMLTWRSGAGVRVERYWQLDCSPTTAREEAQVVAELRQLVFEATKMRLIADVPLGLFLSGGIDSSVVLAAMRRVSSGKIKTFSVTFRHKSFDESQYARALAQQFETEHHEFEVTPQALECVQQMPAMFDEPFADVAAIPTYYLSKLTRDHVTVALSGDGGDENFGGYDRYYAMKVLGAISRIPGHRAFCAAASLLPYSSAERSKLRYAKELLRLVGVDARARYKQMLLGMFSEESLRALYRDDFRTGLKNSDGGESFMAGWETPGAADDLARAMACDITSYIPECLNPKVDIASMAASLEVRSPFLDHKLVEFSARIPSALKINGRQQKYILKRAFHSELPAYILNRRKAGFAMPLAEWFRGELRPVAFDALLSTRSAIGSVFDLGRVRCMLEEHASGRHNWHVQLWRLLILEFWFQARNSAC